MKMRPTYQRTVGRHDTQHKGPAYTLAIVLRGPGLTKACHTHTSAGGNARCLKKEEEKKWQRALLNATSSVGDKPCGYSESTARK